MTSERRNLETLFDSLAGRLDVGHMLRKGDTVVVYAPWTRERKLTSLGVMIETGLAGYLAKVGQDKGYRVLPSTGIPGSRGRVVRLGGSLRAGAGPGGEHWIEVDVTLYAEPDLQVLKRASERILATRTMLENLSSTVEAGPRWEGFLFRVTEPVTDDAAKSDRVEVHLSAPRYVKGEKAVIRFRSTMDGFAYVFCLIEDGSVSMLAPHMDHKQVQVTAGEWVTYPGELEQKLGMEVLVSPLDGHAFSRETIKVVVTDRPLEEFWKVPTAEEGTLAGTGVDIGALVGILDSLATRLIRWTCGQSTYLVEEKGTE